MGLSSATGCEIKLVYPDKKHSLLPLLSASYGPRVGDSHPPRITIMMTDMSGWPDRSKEFKVNHFVSMIKFEHQTLLTSGSRSHVKGIRQERQEVAQT